MIRLHASWVVPISGPPLRDGWVEIDLGRIAAYGSEDSPRRTWQRSEAARVVDLGGVAIMPGLVNAHTHLELTYLRGQITPGSSFVAWIRDLMAARRQRSDPRAAEILDGVAVGIAEAVRCGTAVVGDISNTLVTFGPLAQGPLAAVVFYELIGFKAKNPVELVEDARQTIAGLPAADRVRPSLAAHAPYSVAPLVFRAMRRTLDRESFAPCSVHLAESVEELEFIRSAGGAWRTLLEELDVWDASWVAPGMSPVEYLDACGFLGPHVLAIHGVQMTSSDLARLRARGSTLVTCPRSNQYTNAGTPPIGKFYESGVRVAVGTDSLASVPDLNLFAELATMRSLAPSVPAARLLESATKQGAIALSFDGDYGTIERGKCARLIAVEVPAGTDDVEEYLVSGIHPEQVRWIEP